MIKTILGSLRYGCTAPYRCGHQATRTPRLRPILVASGHQVGTPTTGRCRRLRGRSQRTRIAPRRRPLVNQSEATTAWRTSVAKDAIVSQELADKFKTEKDSPYLRFVRGEGLDIISAQYVPNLRTAELKPWARKSGKGVFINHEASRTSNDCYVCEIAPGRKLEPQHHLFEEMISSSPAAARPRCGTTRAPASPLNGRRARSSPSRSIAGTSTSTDRARNRCVMSLSPMRPRSSTSTTTSISCSITGTISSTASPARPTITAPRASRSASCCRPISCPTRSTCR